MRLFIPICVASLLLAMAMNPAFGQSPFGTGGDKGSLLLMKDGGFFHYNFTKDVFRVSYEEVFDRKENRILADPAKVTEPIHYIPRYGITVQATPGGNIGSLFVSDDLQAGAEVTLSLGLANLLSYRRSKRASDWADILRPIINENGPSMPYLQNALEKAEHVVRQASDTLSVRANDLRRANDPVGLEDARIRYQRATQDLEAARQARAAAQEAVDERRRHIADAEKQHSPFVDVLREASLEDYTQAQKDSLLFRIDRMGPGRMIHDQVDVLVSFSRHAYTFLDEEAGTFDEQVAKNYFNGLAAHLAYSAHFGGARSPVVGVAIGLERSNNINDLSQIDLRDIVFTSNGETTMRTGETVRKVYQGTLVESTIGLVESDLVFYPFGPGSRQLATNVFTRTRIKHDKTFIRPGIGFFLTDKGAPLNVIGGLSLSVDEDKKPRVDLVAGFNF